MSGSGTVASSGGSASVASSSAGSGGAIEGCAGQSAGDETIDATGQPGKLLLKGMVVTPDQAFSGEVLVVGDSIACVAASCASNPDAASATIVTTKGIILPGAHRYPQSHSLRHLRRARLGAEQSYENHNQWTNEPRYGAMVDAKQYLNGEASSPVDLNCELEKYGELKGLIAGTTSIVGAGTPPSNKACYGTLARTIDQTPNGLGTDRCRWRRSFPRK